MVDDETRELFLVTEPNERRTFNRQTSTYVTRRTMDANYPVKFPRGDDILNGYGNVVDGAPVTFAVFLSERP